MGVLVGCGAAGLWGGTAADYLYIVMLNHDYLPTILWDRIIFAMLGDVMPWLRSFALEDVDCLAAERAYPAVVEAGAGGSHPCGLAWDARVSFVRVCTLARPIIRYGAVEASRGFAGGSIEGWESAL